MDYTHYCVQGLCILRSSLPVSESNTCNRSVYAHFFLVSTSPLSLSLVHYCFNFITIYDVVVHGPRIFV